MAREIKDAALLTVQVVIESPDEVVMVCEAPIVEFPGKKAHEVLEAVECMQEQIAPDFKEFVNFANDKISTWIEEKRTDGWR